MSKNIYTVSSAEEVELLLDRINKLFSSGYEEIYLDLTLPQASLLRTAIIYTNEHCFFDSDAHYRIDKIGYEPIYANQYAQYCIRKIDMPTHKNIIL